MKPVRFILLSSVILSCVAVAVGVTAQRDAAKTVNDTKTQANRNPVDAQDAFSPYVDQDGNISLPEDYKQKWSHLGSWAVAKKPGETVHEMHDVYTQPQTISDFNKTGQFPDGTVLVKEVRKTQSDRLTTGHAAWSADIKIWFVMIKDHKERFKNNDHWGDGWGWALFEAKDPTKNVSAGYDTSCIACHTPVADSDWVYAYGYPDLKRSKR